MIKICKFRVNFLGGGGRALVIGGKKLRDLTYLLILVSNEVRVSYFIYQYQYYLRASTNELIYHGSD